MVAKKRASSRFGISTLVHGSRDSAQKKTIRMTQASVYAMAVECRADDAVVRDEIEVEENVGDQRQYA